MVVVTISMLVTQPPLEGTYQEVRNVVLSQLEELVLSEVPERFNKRMNEETRLELSTLTLEHAGQAEQGLFSNFVCFCLSIAQLIDFYLISAI